MRQKLAVEIRIARKASAIVVGQAGTLCVWASCLRPFFHAKRETRRRSLFLGGGAHQLQVDRATYAKARGPSEQGSVIQE